MDFLALCQRVRQESGGVAGTNGTPTAVAGQIGQLKKIVDWTNDAWRDLWLKHDDWLFKWTDFTLPTVASDNDYSAADASVTDLAQWDEESFRIYLASAGVSDESFLTRMDYRTWRNVWSVGNQTPGRPNQMTIKPDLHIGFGPVPDDIYTVTGKYMRSFTDMTGDTDEPTGLPAEYHMCIVYRALEKYAADEGAPEVYAKHRSNHIIMERSLERKQLPRWGSGRPLA